MGFGKSERAEVSLVITAASLKSEATLKGYTVRELGEMAQQLGIPGWRSLKKDELVRKLVRAAKADRRSSPRNSSLSGAVKPKGNKSGGRKSPLTSTKRTSTSQAKMGDSKATQAKKSKTGKPAARSTATVSARADSKAKPKQGTAPAAKSSSTPSRKSSPPAAEKRKRKTSPQAIKRIQQLQESREQQMDLSQSVLPRNGHGTEDGAQGGRAVEKDRIVLLVRDAYWLQACWDLTRASIERARAAMAEHWHAAKPMLRVFQVDRGATTSAAERVVRDIEIHGGVRNWYIDVTSPPQSFRAEVGYLAANGRFYSLARSNTVTTPLPGASEGIDGHWKDVAEDYERIYAMSGGYNEERTSADLQELFEERLQRPMGSPVGARFGVGAERLLNRNREFQFEIDAEMIVMGRTKPHSHVTLAGEPVKLRDDGSFAVRLSLPDRRQVLPIVASSSDGVEQRTIVLAVERNTKAMEPVIHEASDQ
jgi:uncharacterized protein